MKWIERERLVALWRSVRSRGLNLETLRRAATHNFPLKLLSVMIAFSLWFFVNFGERDTEESLKVPLELRNIPAHLMITSPRVDFIDLRVSGPRTLLGRIDHNRLAIGLDLGGVRPGPAVFRVDAESLNLPRGVKTVRINPAQITLELERVAHKSVPVHVRLTGKPPPELQVTDTKVSPETVQLTGPASDIEDVHGVNTEPLDVHTATIGTIERELPLESVGDYVSFSANRVAAQVRIDEVSVTRELKHVSIEVRNAAFAYRVVPDSVRLTVRGPKHLVTDLELDAGAAYIDAEHASVGNAVVKPTIELPTGVELVSSEPGRVQLILWRGKRTGHERR
jgi:YbbR domain-containing protein